MSLSADEQAQIVGIGAVLLLGIGGGVWRTATLRGDQNARWASRVELAVAALDEKTITQLETLRKEVNAALPPLEEQPGFSPLTVIADLAPLSQSAERAVELHRTSQGMGAALRHLLAVGRIIVGGLTGLLAGTACAAMRYAELWNWTPLRLIGLVLLALSGAVVLACGGAYVYLQDRLATAEQLAGTAGQTP